MPILRPTINSSPNWENPEYAIDGNESTPAKVSTSRFSYSNKILTLGFDFPSITGTISSMTLHVRARCGKDTIKIFLDINGEDTKRITQTPIVNDDANSVSPRTDSVDISNYIGSVSTISLTPYNSNWSSNTLELYELYIEYTISYTVRFLGLNGNELSSQLVLEGSSATPPDNTSISIPGHTFTGWDTDFSNVKSNLTVTAQYTKNKYTVTFKDHNGKTLKTQIVEYESSAEAPDVPSISGYTFTGWDTDFKSVTSDLTVTAIYKKLYTVRFLDYNGDVLKSEPVPEGNSATPPSDPSRNGYVFKGWNGTYTNISSNVDITAIYKKLYTVQFLNWNGDLLKSENVEEGKSATAPSDPSRTGYTFTGWNPSNFSNITSDLTVTAQYTINKYTLTFKDHDGTVLKEEQNVTHGSSVTAPSNPSREGYTFTGWNPSDFSNITSDLTVTAQYTINKYTVTFKDWNGTILKEEQNVTHGSSATPPSNPSKEGHTFTGWDKSFSNVTSNLVVTAQYEINKYTVTFVYWNNGTTVSEEQTVNYGSGAIAPSIPSKEGHTFDRWDTDFSSVKSNLTITAIYTKNTYTVTFIYWNNGTVSNTQTVEYGSQATPPNIPSREGYTFTGWNPSNFSNITGDLTVTAQYAINTYTVIFKDYDGTILKEEQIVEYGSDAIPPNNPSREGYTFTGWDTVFSNVKSNLVVTATYIENTASINKILIGDTTTDNLYVGDSNVIAVYIGDFLVFGIDMSE